MDRSVTFRAGASDAGNTLGVFLRQRGVSRHILTILKRTPEGILLNGEAAFTSRTLSAGDQVTIFVKEAEPPSPVAALPLPFPVIYEDEDLLVVDKPSGMAIHPSQGHHDNTLANAAAWYFQQKGESFVFRCINRLDRDTTGLLILAKNALSASILSAMLQKRQIGRTYLAAVEGDLPESGVIDAPIGRVPGSLIERRVDPEGGDAARTRYRRLLCRQLPLPGGGQPHPPDPGSYEVHRPSAGRGYAVSPGNTASAETGASLLRAGFSSPGHRGGDAFLFPVAQGYGGAFSGGRGECRGDSGSNLTAGQRPVRFSISGRPLTKYPAV